MTPQGQVRPIASAGEAEQVIVNLGRIMDALLETVGEETSLVRAGKLRQATDLEATKSELASRYLFETERLKVSRNLVAEKLPDFEPTLHTYQTLSRRKLRENPAPSPVGNSMT